MTIDEFKIIKNVHEISNMNYRLLCLSYFFESYAKETDLSDLVKQIPIPLGQNTGYQFSEDLLEDMLKDIYNSTKMSLLTYCSLFNSIRNVAGAFREGFGDNTSRNPCSPEQMVFRNTFKTDIFIGDNERFESFDGIVRFIRNVLSHNIEDKIEIKKGDYERQRNYWLNTKNKSIMQFEYDYNSRNSAIYIPKYKIKPSINIDWNCVKDGDLFGNLISSPQLFLFIEFCYNASYFLFNRYKI